MKKRMSKLLSLFCAAVLVMGVFAGCSTQKKLQKVTVSDPFGILRPAVCGYRAGIL